MMNELEEQLESLEQSWPGKSVAEDVGSLIESKANAGIEARRSSAIASLAVARPWIEMLAVAAVIVLVFIPLLRFKSEKSVQSGQDQKALKEIAITEFDNSFLLVDNDPDYDPKKLVDLPETAVGMVVDMKGKPVAGAKVSVSVRRYGVSVTELTRLGPWNAVTNEQGEYEIHPRGQVYANHVEVLIKVAAKSFADVVEYGSERLLAGEELPTVQLLDGMPIQGQIVDPDGRPLPKSVVRFFSGTEEGFVWNSGPLTVNEEGKFTLSVPWNAKTIGSVYPRGFASRFFTIARSFDQGKIVVERGVLLKGCVLAKDGKGLPNTIVGYKNIEMPRTHSTCAIMGRAVRTDKDGYFRLPPLSGSYELSVTKTAPDYARQMMLAGDEPPFETSQVIVTSEIDKDELISLSE